MGKNVFVHPIMIIILTIITHQLAQSKTMPFRYVNFIKTYNVVKELKILNESKKFSVI